MIKYNVVMCCYDKTGSCLFRTHAHTHTHTHTPNQELHMRPHLPSFYHNNTSLHCILSFNNT